MQSFFTEEGYDVLKVNDIEYSGSVGPEGIVPSGNMEWSSDSSIVKSGWKLCPLGATTTSTTTVTLPSGSMWQVTSGPCTIDGDFCAQSPNYPREYGKNEACTIAVDISRAVPVEVRSFSTEDGYDVLKVNDIEYQGSVGPEGVVPSRNIEWSSDSSIQMGGWKLCPAVAARPSTTIVATSFADVPTTTPSPPARAPMWEVTSGPCTVDDDWCLRSPHYPLPYGADEACAVNVDASRATPIRVMWFWTERRYDRLSINGAHYHGGRGPGGVTPRGIIGWSSDSSVQKSGWRLCPSGEGVRP